MESSSSNLKKYLSRNPLRQFFLKRFLRKLDGLFMDVSSKTVLDAGCGEGFVIKFLQSNHPEIRFWGIDINPSAIKFAQGSIRGGDFKIGSILNLPFSDSFFDLVICSEVLEHLKNPEKALCELRRVSRKYLLLTVPNEPWFRFSSFLTGRLRSLGKHPDHIQTWSKKEFVLFVEKHLEVVSVTTSFPWTLVLCKKRKP